MKVLVSSDLIWRRLNSCFSLASSFRYGCMIMILHLPVLRNTNKEKEGDYHISPHCAILIS